MWDGCVEIVLGFDTKDGWLVVGTWLLNGWKMVVEHFAVVESWLEGGMNDGQDKDGWSADEGESGIPACRGSGGAFGRRLANCGVPTPFG